MKGVLASGFPELLFGNLFNRSNMDHVQLLNLLNFWLLKICLRDNLGRCAWSFFAELLGDKLAFSIVGYDVLKLLDLGLQGHVCSL